MLTIVPSRREIHEIENRKRERRKKREQKGKQEERERQERMMEIMSRNPMMGYGMQNGMIPYGGGQGMQMPMGMPQQQQQPPADQSGNPYAPREGR